MSLIVDMEIDVRIDGRRSTQSTFAASWSRIAVAAMSGICLALATPAWARKDPPSAAEFGPPPDWNEYRALAETTIRSQLVDPDSAIFSWPWGMLAAAYKPILGKRVHGYVTCGLVNSRNRMGGYTGNSIFVMVINHDRVVYSEVAGPSSLLAESCNNSAFPPASSMQVPSASPTSLGIGFVPHAEGIYIIGVARGGNADRAGLKRGMIIAKANGVPLKGLAVDAARQALMGAPGKTDLEMSDGTFITVTRQ